MLIYGHFKKNIKIPLVNPLLKTVSCVPPLLAPVLTRSPQEVWYLRDSFDSKSSQGWCLGKFRPAESESELKRPHILHQMPKVKGNCAYGGVV